MTTLTQAFNQWASRPADERFSSLESLITAVRSVRERARTSKHVDLAQCSVVDVDETPMLKSPSGIMADMTHHAFGQLCRLVEAPAHYLRTLPAALAADNLNHGLAALPESADADTMAFDATLLVDLQDAGAPDPARKIRQFCSEKYGRIWSLDVAERLQRLTLERPEWQPAPAAFEAVTGYTARAWSASSTSISNLPGPGTTSQISAITVLKSRPALATSDGLVVTPSRRPVAASSLISARSAVSTKNFIWEPRCIAGRAVPSRITRHF